MYDALYTPVVFLHALLLWDLAKCLLRKKGYALAFHLYQLMYMILQTAVMMNYVYMFFHLGRYNILHWVSVRFWNRFCFLPIGEQLMHKLMTADDFHAGGLLVLGFGFVTLVNILFALMLAIVRQNLISENKTKYNLPV